MELIGNFTELELELLKSLDGREKETSQSVTKYHFEKVERKSDKEFDLSVQGHYDFYWKQEKTISAVEITEAGRKDMGSFTVPANQVSSTKFSAWLPLHVIHEIINWCHRDVARMSDYPSMARSGDWSGIRDSSEKKIWAIFNKFILVTEGEQEFAPEYYQ